MKKPAKSVTARGVDLQPARQSCDYSRRSGKRWLSLLILKLWDIAWDLWEQRNGINAAQKTRRLRLTLHARVTSEYDQGYSLLYPQSHRLFTQISLPTRLFLSDQSLASWLLRVDQARRRARETPTQVTHDLSATNRRALHQQIQATSRRNTNHMQQLMARWLNPS